MGYERIAEGQDAREPSPKAATTVINSMQVGLETLEVKKYIGLLAFSYPGVLPDSGAPIAIGLPVYNDTQYTWIITSVRASLSVSPVDNPVIIDIRYHPTSINLASTIFSSRPILAIGAGPVTTGKVTTIDITTIVPGGVLLLDLFQVDGATMATDLVVQIDYEY